MPGCLPFILASMHAAAADTSEASAVQTCMICSAELQARPCMICTALTAYLWLCRACELQTAAADTSKASAVQCGLVRRQDLWPTPLHRSCVDLEPN